MCFTWEQNSTNLPKRIERSLDQKMKGIPGNDFCITHQLVGQTNYYIHATYYILDLLSSQNTLKRHQNQNKS